MYTKTTTEKRFMGHGHMVTRVRHDDVYAGSEDYEALERVAQFILDIHIPLAHQANMDEMVEWYKEYDEQYATWHTAYQGWAAMPWFARLFWGAPKRPVVPDTSTPGQYKVNSDRIRAGALKIALDGTRHTPALFVYEDRDNRLREFVKAYNEYQSEQEKHS